MAAATFDPQNVNLDTADQTAVVCYIDKSTNEYNGHLGARVSALFVVLIVSTAATFFPVLATRVRRLKIPLYVYLFARYFGAGVIVATAFIHLLDPAYDEIGPASCVGMTGNWASYSWPPAICLASAMIVFLMDFAAERYVEKKYAFAHGDPDVDGAVTGRSNRKTSHQYLHSGEQDGSPDASDSKIVDAEKADDKRPSVVSFDNLSDTDLEHSFQQQIAAFLILEFGVIFHSVIIGLALGTAGDEFSTLYPVIVFHQSFEGLGIGARMSAIPFPRRIKWLPWVLCTAYGLTTPIAIAVGLGLRTTYNSGSNVANIVSGVLDSTSAGILVYTGLVELLARDFLFNPNRTKDDKQLAFMMVCVFLGAGIMALLGKWA
ncbi:MAG: high-affinity Zn(2+) transporter zrt1 [Chrysothrix sp. TS-e1954]|nr:MAG: high-affinity Zn(2+) transporter zrt1 [Chrysothrix sp. TS-e1954]